MSSPSPGPRTPRARSFRPGGRCGYCYYYYYYYYYYCYCYYYYYYCYYYYYYYCCCYYYYYYYYNSNSTSNSNSNINSNSNSNIPSGRTLRLSSSSEINTKDFFQSQRIRFEREGWRGFV